MQIFIVDDDPFSQFMVNTRLQKEGYEAVIFTKSRDALAALEKRNEACLVILDWMMPEIDGIQICKRLKSSNSHLPCYILMVTACGSTENVVTALGAGADDYVTKPFRQEELSARISVGLRTLNLQTQLAHQIELMEVSLSQIKNLEGLLPICCHCKNIRDEKHYWHRVEQYISTHTDALFSHAICPDCLQQHYGELGESIVDQNAVLP